MSRQSDSPLSHTRTKSVTTAATQTRLDQIEPIDATRCPLCGQSNQCAMAAGADDHSVSHEPCWCVQEHFPAALLERVPPAARRAACICQRCLRAAEQD